MRSLECVNFEALVNAVIIVESNGNPNAVSHCGAKGLMQLMDATGKECLSELIDNGILPEGTVYDPFDPIQNKTIGSCYLNKLLNRFNSLEFAIAAYNGGPTRISALINDAMEQNKDISCLASSGIFKAVEPHLPNETREYVKKVLNKYSFFSKQIEVDV